MRFSMDATILPARPDTLTKRKRRQFVCGSMAETLNIPTQANREEIYQRLIPQIKSLVAGEVNLTANLANIAAALREAFGFFWVGFYLVEGQELVLGPFQGPVACTRIAHGRGVCGQAWAQKKTIIVPNVAEYPGHIACSAASQSEIVVPIRKAGQVALVLDVDSDRLAAFSDVDEQYLNALAQWMEEEML